MICSSQNMWFQCQSTGTEPIGRTDLQHLKHPLQGNNARANNSRGRLCSIWAVLGKQPMCALPGIPCAGQLAVRGTSTLEAAQHIEQGIPVHRAAACPPARWPRGCTRPHTARPQAYVRRPRTFAARGAGQHCYQGQAPGPAPSPASPGSALLRWRSAELMARLAPLPRQPSCSGLGDL